MRQDEVIPTESSVRSNDDVMRAAERELAAFALAVKEMFGTEQERLSIEDWMQELEAMNGTTENVNPGWRRLTIAAATQVATRVCMLREPSSAWAHISAPSRGKFRATGQGDVLDK